MYPYSRWPPGQTRDSSTHFCSSFLLRGHQLAKATVGPQFYVMRGTRKKREGRKKKKEEREEREKTEKGEREDRERKKGNKEERLNE